MTRPIRWITGPAAAAATALALVVPAAEAPAAATRMPATRAPATAASTDPEFHAALHGSRHFRHARGHSEYERTRHQREVEVTLNNAPRRLYGRWVTVYVNRTRAGSMRVNYRGHAEHEWSTEHRQFVPWAGAGSPVRIRTHYGTLVVSGYYHRAHDD